MPLPTRHLVRALLVVLAAATLFSGCGGGDGDGGLRVDGLDIRYDRDRYEAVAGPIVLEFRNKGSLAHNVVFREVEGAPVAAGDADFIPPGGAVDYDLDLAPGEYEFFCSVPGHEEAGMIATLVVG